jgi:dipeptidyl aminopeptidase/acylaminoacyl peptidase
MRQSAVMFTSLRLCVRRELWLRALLLAAMLSSKVAADDPPETRLGLPGDVFTVEGRPAFVMLPPAEKRRSPQPWVFYAPTLPAYPDEHERWMHEQFLAAGVAVAGIDVGEAYGSPAGRKLFDAFYKEMTGQRGYAALPCLLARSRGGLWMSSWAADHPERVAGLAGIYPAFDLRTYPGLETAAPAYGMTPQELTAALGQVNPIERVDSLAAAKIPAFFIHGDMDDKVPLAENSAEFAKRYDAHGVKALVTLVVPAGQRHSFWEGYFRCQQLVDFAVDRARIGAGNVAKSTNP